MPIDADSLLQQIERDTDRAMSAGSPGDRVLMVLSGYSDPWMTGENQAQSVSLVVPNQDDFYAETLNLYLQARLYDENGFGATTATDITFRPAMWVTTCNAPIWPTGTNQPILGTPNNVVVQDANATWRMTDTFNGSYQGENGLRISTAYSTRYGQGAVSSEVNLSAWPGTRRFFIPRKIPKGNTITIAINPTFSRKDNTNPKTQFRVGVVFQGHKIVRRFA